MRSGRTWIIACACVLLATVVPAASASPTHVTAAKVFGRRYCELLLVHPTATAYAADVYNTYGLNDCPAAKWTALDPKTVASTNHALAAVRNGPRFWAMNEIEKFRSGRGRIKDLGGIRMIKEATIALPTLIQTPYSVHRVSRTTIFIWNAGATVHELRAPDGSTWVMQSWSEQIDPSLNRSDLARLGSKLQLPASWSYRSRRLKTALRIKTVHTDAEVTQDILDDTYSRVS
jgi:hypothetical protein